ncbi:MAG: Ldh family oxidoreductase [Verrucomicrobia bacterium]|nr:Ldh family oxidoreductase [Verrucomicrobiota bacterium]
MKDPELVDHTAWLPCDLLEQFMVDVFRGLGVPDEEARICADVLSTSDRRGISSHGISRLKPIYYDRILKDKVQQPLTNFEIVRDHKSTAVVDGHHGMGMVIAKRCMEMAIAKARAHGTGCVVARNSTHFGIVGYYTLMATQANMIGLVSTNARPAIAPTFGVDNMLGTNPVVFGFPTDEPFDFTNDYATSIIQRGTVELYARENRPLPPGVVIDHAGNVKTNAGEVLKDLIAGKAALAPVGGIGEELGGYKGYGFATVAELLSCALQQGAFLQALSGHAADGRKVPYSLGHFFLAIDVQAFADPSDFRKRVGEVLRALRASRKAPGCERIYTCGEKEYDASLERARKGVPVDLSIQAEMIAMRDELGLTQYRFPFG